jgi:hypothetical protein
MGEPASSRQPDVRRAVVSEDTAASGPPRQARARTVTKTETQGRQEKSRVCTQKRS